ncbi:MULTISPECIES: hypothetical protein [unclassified Nonomuraea]|uniref:hypothetical protein n=1 Tax=unclassified Nonomuraea TaxID=2593643 RepID=UPI0033D38CDF
MAGVLRNLRIVLGVDFNESGLKKADRALQQLDKRLGVIGRRAATGAGLAALAGSAVALTGALLPAVGAVAAMPGALAAAKTATATLKVGLIGMGDAMSAVAGGDAQALEEALSKLSPSARAVVKEADRLFGSFKAVQEQVQSRMFRGLAREMEPVAANLLPGIRKGMLGVASGFNLGAREALKFGQTPMAKGAVNATFSSTSRIMANLASAVRPALAGISQLTVKSLPLAERMASWGVNGIKAAGAFLASERGAAVLERTVDRAGDTLAQLGRIGLNIGRTVVSVFGQMDASGDGVLDTIERLTAQAAAWVRSAEGQRQIADTFRLLRDVAADVADVLPLVAGPLGVVARLLTSLPEPLRGVVTQGLALALVIGPLAGKFGGLVSGVLHMVSAVKGADGPIGRLRDRLTGVGDGVGKARGALAGAAGVLGGPWGIALAAGIGAIAVFAQRQAEADQRVKDLTETLDKQSGAITADTRAMVVQRLEQEGLLRVAQQLGLNLGTVTDAALGNKTALGQVNSALDAYGNRLREAAASEQVAGAGTDELSRGATRLGIALRGQNSELGQAVASAHRTSQAMGRTASAATPAADGIRDMGAAASSTSGRMQTLVAQLVRFNSLTGDADLAALGARDSIDELSGAIKRGTLRINERTGRIDINTKASRENTRRIIDAIRAAADHADKLVKEGKSTDVANAAFKRHMDRLTGVLQKAGLSRQAIDALVRRYVTMPGQINAATNRIRDRKVRIEVRAGGELIGYKVQGGTLLKASGGILPGWSPGRDIHMFTSPTGGVLGLSGGEAVMRPEWTRAVGPAYIDRMNAVARRGGVSAVAREMGVERRWLTGPDALGGEGAFFADGGVIVKGSVGGVSSVQKMANRANALYGIWARNMGTGISKALSKLLLGGPGVQKALAWARRQNGKPYVWGGVGPGGYDCSGFMGAILNVIKGRNPYQRMFTTWSFGANGGPGGFVRNRKSGFMVGVSDAGVGHMAGTLGKVNVESRGSRGVVVGSGARGYNNGLFSRRYGLKFDQGGILPPGWTAAFNGTREPEYVFTQRQMEQGGGGRPVEIHNHFHIPPHPNRYEIGKEIYEALGPYMERSRRKLPA